MKLICPNCGTPIPARQVNVQTMTAACIHCDAVFAFDRDALLAERGKRRKLITPDGFTVDEADERLHIRVQIRRILGPLEWFSIVFFVLGTLVLTPVSVAAFASWSTGLESVALLFLSLLAGSFAAFFAYCLAFFAVSHADIDLDDTWLTVSYSPLPWISHRIPAEQIEDFELEQIENSFNYVHLIAVTEDGRRHRLDNYQRHHAEYLKRSLEAVFSRQRTLDAVDAIDSLDDAELISARLSDEGEIILPDDDDRRDIRIAGV